MCWNLFFFKQKTAYEMRISDWSSDVCSSDLDKGEAGRALKAAGADKARLETAIDNMRGGEKVQDANAEEARQALEKYTIDLTARSETGKPDPVIGRDEEYRRTIQVLPRRTKNRSEEHTSELQSPMRTSHAVFCSQKKPEQYDDVEHI